MIAVEVVIGEMTLRLERVADQFVLSSQPNGSNRVVEVARTTKNREVLRLSWFLREAVRAVIMESRPEEPGNDNDVDEENGL